MIITKIQCDRCGQETNQITGTAKEARQRGKNFGWSFSRDGGDYCKKCTLDRHQELRSDMSRKAAYARWHPITKN
jgi:hypothetical protein